MRIDKDMKVHTLDDHESWQLFVKYAGDAANLEDIKPLAQKITKECDGLPLAITVTGAFMRGKEKVELWDDALRSLRMSEPHDKVVEEKVYKVIKWSFDSLVSQQRSCSLYCSLYPAAIRIKDLINCWWAEGLLGEHDTYHEAYNRGVTLVERLKDACLLETHDTNSVKMHDVVCDVARWIDENNSLIQAGVEKSQTKLSASVKRISLVSSNTQRLPDFSMKCPETTSLLLQDNRHLVKMPDEFFLAFPALRVLNLSETGIRALPSSINSLCQLRALILQGCSELTELPPIGNLFNLQLLDCDGTWVHCLPQGMDKLTNLRLLNMPADYLKESIGQGFFLNISSIEMLDMHGNCLESTCFDEISSLHNLTSLFITLDSSSILNRDHTWMSRLKRFYIEVGKTEKMFAPFDKSTRTISVSKCETFSNGELSGMLQFASDFFLKECMGLRKLIAYKSFDGLKSLEIQYCSCDFKPAEEGSEQFDDPLSNLEHLRLYGTLGEPQSMWEHLEELYLRNCYGIRKLPLSIQTSKNIKVIKGYPEWWSQLEWDVPTNSLRGLNKRRKEIPAPETHNFELKLICRVCCQMSQVFSANNYFLFILFCFLVSIF